MYTERTITVYNRYLDKNTDECTFFRVDLPAHWEDHDGKSTLSASTNVRGDAYSMVYIPNVEVDGRCYCPPEDFSDNVAGDYFTFGAEDVIFRNAIPGPDRVSAAGMRDLRKTHKGNLLVAQCDALLFGSKHMQHFEVYCKE